MTRRPTLLLLLAAATACHRDPEMTVDTITPSVATPGTVVHITGTGFLPKRAVPPSSDLDFVGGLIMIRFGANGEAPALDYDPTHLVAMVPNFATGGRILVTQHEGDEAITADGPSFTLRTSAEWAIAAYFPRDFSPETASPLPSGQALLAGGTLQSFVANPLTKRDDKAVETATPPALRSRHAASVLPDGDVLLCGGKSGSPDATCDRFSEGSGDYTSAPPMSTARRNHTATPLIDGRVLVAGGEVGDAVATATAEIFDPGPQTWTNAGSMKIARFAHTATLLQDGRVLVAGGADGAAALTSAEVFDPANNTWTTVGEMTMARTDHRAVLLGDGSVLVAAGRDAPAAESARMTTAERFAPAPGTWSATAPLTTLRQDPMVAGLKDGRAIVCGGYFDELRLVLRDCEAYSATTGQWVATTPMQKSRRGALSVTLPSGSVMVFGGGGNNNASEVLDAAKAF